MLNRSKLITLLVCLVCWPVLAWGQQEMRSATKGASTPLPITGTVIDANHNGLDVNIVGGSASGGTQYAEDSAHVSGDSVNMAGVVQQAADAALSSDGDRSVLQVDGNGYLKVNIKAGAGSGGTAMVDDAAFTPAVTSITPIGAMFDDVSPDSVNEGDGGIPRMSGNRNLYTTIRDAAGNERGLNVDANGEIGVGAIRSALPAGTNAIGKLAANSGVDIGDVDVASIVPGTGATNLGKAEDAAHASGDTGVMALCVRSASPADRSAGATDGDYEPCAVDSSGRLHTSANIQTIAGTTVDTNSGSKSAGTIRVVIATDQPALTNKLLVTPDANSAVNVAQMNGVAVAMGAGATGTGVQRVNPVSSSATGAAPPAAASYIGGLGSGATGGFLTGLAVADTFKSVSVTSATTTLLATGVSGRHVRITSLNLVSAIANNVALISGTGATCGTGTAGIAGGTTAANGWNFAANGGLTLGSGLGTVMQTAATGDSVCIVTSSIGPLAGSISYAIY